MSSSSPPLVTLEQKELLLGQRGLIVWLFGLSGAGKSTLSDRLARHLHDSGRFAIQLDGDVLRQGLCRGLGFTDEGRMENLRRAAETARLVMQSGVIVVCSFITPLNSMRQMIESITGGERLLTVHVHCPYEVCAQRDPKGLYAQAASNQRPNFTGRDSAFEAPDSPPGLTLNTSSLSVDECSRLLWDSVLPRIRLGE